MYIQKKQSSFLLSGIRILPEEALEDGCMVMPIEQISISSVHMVPKSEQRILGGSWGFGHRAHSSLDGEQPCPT